MIKMSTRVVLILPNVVIKIPVSKRGYLQGKNESKLYRRYKGYHLLGRLRWERFGIVCMKRYRVATELPDYAVRDIKFYIKPLDIKNCDLYNPKNWGYNKDNQLLLIDYGINEEISKMYENIN